jgi:hypothetical protein
MSHYVHAVPLIDNNRQKILTDLQQQSHGYIDNPDWMFISMMQNDLKSANYYSSVILKDRSFPPPQYMLTQKIPETIPTSIVNTYGDDWKLLKNDAPDQQYASLLSDDESYSICTSTGIGGQVTVSCNSEKSGMIRVLVNAVPGWEYSLNGDDYRAEPVGQWLTVDVPAGQNTVIFRYEPWYAWAGLFMIPLSWITVIALLVYTTRRASVQSVQRETLL